MKYCNMCGSTLGVDCGVAEPDFDDKFCSKGCFQEFFEENKIVQLVAGRLQKGYKKYNQIMPIDDGRDWIEECLEEILDCCVYLGNALIILKEKRKD